MSPRSVPPRVLVGFGALYFAQGIPLGIAAEFLPVTLRQNHASYSFVAALGWLQLPWALKVLWAHAGDTPALRARTRGIVTGLQLGLALTLAAYAWQPFSHAPVLWLALTVLGALFASTQDIFVDGLAVRTLGAGDRGFGNVAQVGAYRLGIVAGGAGLLALGGLLSERTALLLLAALVGIASLGVLGVAPRSEGAEAVRAPRPRGTEWSTIQASLASMAKAPVRRILVLAFGFKLGIHAAASLLKPALVDAGWSKERIGTLAVTVGTLAGVLGALAGGLLHRRLGDRRALLGAGLLQAAVCVPLVLVVDHASHTTWVTAALAVEHAASGLGTTVLFAALMGATNRRNAALQFTVLSTANALSLALASALAGALADRVHDVRIVFVLGSVLSLLVLWWLRGWDLAARTLRDADETPGGGAAPQTR